MTRWTTVALGVLAIVAATVLPWYLALGVDGSAELTGWGAWARTGDVDADLRPLPLGLLAVVSAGAMVYSAVRAAFGTAVIGATCTLVAAILPFMLTPLAVGDVPGRGAVGVEIAAAPPTILGIGLVATVVCWIGYARCVLRASPRAEA